MVHAKYTEHSEEFKELLHDFMNFEKTGFKPWGTGIGGKDHYRARGDYWEKTIGSRDAFRALAKRVATKACSLIPNDKMADQGLVSILEQDEESDDGANPNPQSRFIDMTGGEELARIEEALDGYKPGEIMQPYIIEYPTKNKVGIVWGLDGDVEDKSSNRFKLSNDGQSITRFRRVPKVWLSADGLLNGMGQDKKEGALPGFRSSDIDILVVDSVIQERLKDSVKDENGEYWEPREIIDLPFPCLQTMVSIEGKAMKTFKVRKNQQGFRWAAFWLVGKHAHVATGASHARRFGGTRVQTPDTQDDASMYSYRTVRSNTVPVKSVKARKKATTSKHKMKTAAGKNHL